MYKYDAPELQRWLKKTRATFYQARHAYCTKQVIVKNEGYMLQDKNYNNGATFFIFGKGICYQSGALLPSCLKAGTKKLQA